ncbi:MAG: hypothetical protein NTX98_01510 [Candidatus Doudnabacteria bacterium]|nr:hypothetical protein [Candidatus Doudnabacteria bacterium]
MDKISNLALIAQAIEAAEKNIQSARQLLKDLMGGPATKANLAALSEKAVSLSVSEGGKVIEGVFDGQNMIGPDKKQYPVPANYASKSKLIEGDVLKLTIADDGSFIYKQIGPAERKKMLGVLMVDERGDFKVLAEGKTFKVLLASLTYFKAEAGDEVTIVVPKDQSAEWAAVENVIKKGSGSNHADIEMGSEGDSEGKVILDDDEEL